MDVVFSFDNSYKYKNNLFLNHYIVYQQKTEVLIASVL